MGVVYTSFIRVCDHNEETSTARLTNPVKHSSHTTPLPASAVSSFLRHPSPPRPSLRESCTQFLPSSFGCWRGHLALEWHLRASKGTLTAAKHRTPAPSTPSIVLLELDRKEQVVDRRTRVTLMHVPHCRGREPRFALRSLHVYLETRISTACLPLWRSAFECCCVV